MKLLTIISLLMVVPAVFANIRIGVLANRGGNVVFDSWKPTKNYLEKEINESVDITPMPFGKIEKAIENKTIDFVFLNPAMYVENEHRYSIKKILKTKRSYQEKYLGSFGSVIFTKRNNDISLEDWSDKSLGAVSPHSLGGWLIAKGEMAKREVLWNDEDVKYFHNHYKVVAEVMSGNVDIGVVRTGVLEELIFKGKLKKEDFQIIFGRTDTPLRYLSSSLYGEWPLAALKHVSEEKIIDLSMALLKINITAPDISRRIGFEWSFPSNYRKVKDLLKEFHHYPYDHSLHNSWNYIRTKYPFIVYTFFSIIILIIVSFIFTVIDRKRSLVFHKLIKKERDNLKAFLEMIPTSLALLDEDFKILLVNKSFKQIINEEYLNIEGRFLADYIPELKTQNISFSKDLTEAISLGDDLIVIGSDASQTPVSLKAFTQVVSGRRNIVVAIEKLELQKQILHLEDERKIRKAEEEKVRSVGILGSGVAHEINNPLTIINGSIRVMEKYLSKSFFDIGAWNKILNETKQESLRISDIIEGLRLLGKSKEEFTYKNISIGKIIEGALTLVTTRLLQKSVQVEFNHENFDELIYASHSMLHKVFLNILLNAEKSISRKEGQWIKISVERSDQEYLEIRIANSGAKISEEMQERIFIPFSSENQYVPGGGTTLARHKVCLNEHHGDIWLDQKEEFSTFVVKYPFDYRLIP